MEGDKRQVSSSTSTSSFTADLFGSKEPTQSSSSGIFASILSPPTVGIWRNSSNSEVTGSWQQQQSPGNQAWKPKLGIPEHSTEGATSTCNTPYKDKSPMFQEEKAAPCHLSSSLYYGGRDMYSHSSNNYAPKSYPIFKKDGGEDDPNGNNSNGVSRGNWWEGSLYY